MQQSIDEILQYVRDKDDTLLGKKMEFKGQVMSVEEYIRNVFIKYTVDIADYIETFQKKTYDYAKNQIFTTVLTDPKYRTPVTGQRLSFIEYLDQLPVNSISTIGVVRGDEVTPFEEEFADYSMVLEEPSLEEQELAAKKFLVASSLYDYMMLEAIDTSIIEKDEEFREYIQTTFIDYIIEKYDVVKEAKDNTLMAKVGELFEKALAQKNTVPVVASGGEEEIQQLPNDGDPEVEATMVAPSEPVVAVDTRSDVEKIEEFEIVGNTVSTASTSIPTQRELDAVREFLDKKGVVRYSKKNDTVTMSGDDPDEEEIQQLPNDGDPEVEATMALPEEGTITARKK